MRFFVFFRIDEKADVCISQTIINQYVRFLNLFIVTEMLHFAYT